MKILLTGASGFLGRHIQNELLNTNRLYTLSRSGSNYNYNLSIEMPLLDDKFDLVIHSAGKAHMVPKTAADKQAFFDVNLNGTVNLLKGIEQSLNLPKAFVFISSVSVYGRETGLKINETSSLLAKDPYGYSKIQTEDLVTTWCAKNNVLCTILRLPLLVGVNPPGSLGDMIKGIQKGYYFNIKGSNSKKSMVLATDIAKVIIKVSKIGGIYNLTDSYDPSFTELSNIIAQHLDKPKPFNIPLFVAQVLAKFGDVLGNKFPLNSAKLKKITSDLTFDDTIARNTFGWNPTPVLEGLKISNNYL